jgi:acetolactate synthase-1/3 small subunit
MDNSTERFSVELEVHNRYGVLNRITGLYAKRGFNIDSIYSSETDSPEKTRILITSRGDKYIQTQMVRQLSKLYDVLTVNLIIQ